MFKLTEPEIENAYLAIESHGYSALLPKPIEWSVVTENWVVIRENIAAIDLDSYTPVVPLRVYAPKSRATVRVVSLLHPIDLIIYTALTLLVKDDLEVNRLPPKRRTVFSYRATRGLPDRLYDTTGSYQAYRERLEEMARKPSAKYVAIADIADFFPRIYQHRLENVIESCASTPRNREVARVLVKKLIGKMARNNSYGIPVGPYASRILAEAVLIDVDAFLVSEGLAFTRWVDDYHFFTKNEQQSQRILILLAERLYEQHGLTLSALKTKIESREIFLRRFDQEPDDDVDERVAAILEISSRFNPYVDDYIEFSEAERDYLAQVDIEEIIERALEDRALVDYETLTALLRHPALFDLFGVEVQERVGDILLRNVEHLYPIAGEVAGFFARCTQFQWQKLKSIKRKLLKSIQPKHGKWLPDYYVMWVLDVFATDAAWRASPEFARIAREHRSEIVRRSATLAMSTNGTRADAVELKERFGASSPLEQLAILMASRNLGRDERKHWRTSLQLSRILEKVI